MRNAYEFDDERWEEELLRGIMIWTTLEAGNTDEEPLAVDEWMDQDPEVRFRRAWRYAQN